MQRKSCPIAWVQKMFEGLSGMKFWWIVRMSFKIVTGCARARLKPVLKG